MVQNFLGEALDISRRDRSDAIADFDLAATKLDRREFLKSSLTSAVALSTVGTLPWLSACSSIQEPLKSDDQVAIVGGGFAGLNAAFQLKKMGLNAMVFEAGNRVGGRVLADRNVIARDLISEVGGEFFDSQHQDAIRLTRELGLTLIDSVVPSEKILENETFYFDGRKRSKSDVIKALQPLTEKILKDIALIGERISYSSASAEARALDAISIKDYFSRIGMSGWLLRLFTVAYETEYGMDCGLQSSLNFLTLVGLDLRHRNVRVYGDVDERYRVAKGNDQIASELAKRVPEQVLLNHRLISIRKDGRGQYRLAFQLDGSQTKEVRAEFVILALPFSVLRTVQLDVELPDLKRKAIQELGYSNSVKAVVGYREAFWRDRGSVGRVLSDQGFQSAWDSSRLRGHEAAAVSFQLGGRSAEKFLTGDSRTQSFQFCDQFEKVFGVSSEFRNGRTISFDWQNSALSRGSFACYKVGQWTSFGGCEAEPIGRLFFAGDHCSHDFQGTMNGALQSGRVAAEQLMALLRVGKA